MSQRTTNIDLSWAECKVLSDGSVHLIIGGVSPGGISQKVIVKMGPSTIGYIAADLHRAVAELQKTLDLVKAQLRGGGP